MIILINLFLYSVEDFKRVKKFLKSKLNVSNLLTYIGIILIPIILQIFIFYGTKQLSSTIIYITIFEMIIIPIIYLYNFIKELIKVASSKRIRHDIKKILYNLYFHFIASYGLFMAGSLALIESFNPKYPILLLLFSSSTMPEGWEKVFLLIYSIFLIISLLLTFQFGYNHFSYKIEHPSED